MIKYKPLVDKYFYLIWIPVIVLLLIGTIISFLQPIGFIIMIGVNIFCYYFMLSSLFGYVELRRNTLFIKFGFILKKEIPYPKIREVSKERKFLSYSHLSLKNAIEHVNIKYNKYDMVTISVERNDEFIDKLLERIEFLEE